MPEVEPAFALMVGAVLEVPWMVAYVYLKDGVNEKGLGWNHYVELVDVKKSLTKAFNE